MKRSSLNVSLGLLGAFVSVLLVPGCSFELLATGDLPADTSTPPIDDEESNSSNKVTIRFINLTEDQAVDVEFYVEEEPIDRIPDELFVAANLIRRSIGVAGSGLIPPGRADEISLDCNPDLVFGTRGGRFLDAESGDLVGEGEPRWVQEGPLGLCGTVVAIEFFRDGNEFKTGITVAR